MPKVIFYTFRSAPFLAELQNTFGDLFIFKSLKQDLPLIFKRIEQEKPHLVLGLGTSKRTTQETQAINQFNKTKKIIDGAASDYPLFIAPINIPLSTIPTDSFCNWTAYHLAHHLHAHQSAVKLSFLHISRSEQNLDQIIAELLALED